MNEYANALGQYAVRFDRFHATLGVNAIPCQRFVGCDMELMAFAGNAQRASPTHASSVPGDTDRP